MVGGTAILVLGMHRSGTSATAGWLKTLGVNLGPYLMAEDPTQPKGYFEHAEIVGIHDELMAVFGSSWDDPRPLPEGWEYDHRVRFFRAQLMEIIRRDFMTAPLWGAKDPRLCRLLPVWLGMLDELGVPVRAICVLRHPAEVAESLALRNGFSADKSGLLWLRYVLEAERHSRSMPRITIRYGDLLRDSRAESQRIAQALGIVWPKPHDEAADDATDFLERGLRHHESVYFDRFPPPLRRWIVSAYRALKPGSGPSEHGLAILDSLHRELAPYDSYVAACWLERIRNIGLENAQTRAMLTQLQAQFSQNQADAAQIHADLELAQAALAGARSELARAQSELAAVRAELVAARTELAQEVVTISAELTQTRNELTDVRTASTQVSAQLTQARGELERTRADSQRAHQELEAVYRSRYCRFTRPWRTLDTYLRNRRRRQRER
ncbi:MAG: hypothetical protein WB999_03240, partial [Candidatus Binataceae bacterium]